MKVQTEQNYCLPIIWRFTCAGLHKWEKEVIEWLWQNIFAAMNTFTQKFCTRHFCINSELFVACAVSTYLECSHTSHITNLVIVAKAVKMIKYFNVLFGLVVQFSFYVSLLKPTATILFHIDK